MSDLQGSFLGNKDVRSSLTQNRQQAGFGANANLAHGKFLNNGSQVKSFAQEMAALTATGEEIPEELQAKMEEMGYANSAKGELGGRFKKDDPRKASVKTGEGFASGDQLSEDQLKKESLKQEDTRKAFEQSHSRDNVERQSEEKKHYYSSNEATMATAAQDNSKTITEAAREGNVGQQEQRQSDEGQRQQQLANWELLAPRLIEDSKNRAIRLDIPDVDDIQTVIVRMGDSGVDIQAVGSESMVSSFAGREGMLRAALSKRSVKLGSLKAFDAKSLYQQ